MAYVQYPDPEMGARTASSKVYDSSLLTVDRSKELPKLRQNLAFWSRRKCIFVTTAMLITLVAGVIIGIVAGVLDTHPKAISPPENASSSGYSSIPAGPTPTSASLSAPAPTPSAQALNAAPSGDWAFQKTLPISTAPAKEAIVLLTVDNGFQLYHNSQLIATETNVGILAGWQVATAVHISLDPGSNVFAILAQNFPPDTDPNGTTPAGLLASIQISYSDGTTTFVSSDATWRVAQPVPVGFQSLSANDTRWKLATALARYGSGPWGTQVVIPQSYNITTR